MMNEYFSSCHSGFNHKEQFAKGLKEKSNLLVSIVHSWFL